MSRDIARHRRACRRADRGGGGAGPGLRPGTPVAIANVDAHVSVPGGRRHGARARWSRSWARAPATSCWATDERARAEGMCGVVEDGIIPGLFGYEAGQSAVGDIFGWFVRHGVPPEVHARPTASGLTSTTSSSATPPRCGPARPASWRSTGGTATARSSWMRTSPGLLMGATLATRPAGHLPGAAGIHGVRDARRSSSRSRPPACAVDRIVACGGLPERNRLLMQITADITGREFDVAASTQAPALGSAMFGAVAAGRGRGGYDSIEDAAAAMARPHVRTYRPDAAARGRLRRALRASTSGLHDYFGRGAQRRHEAPRASGPEGPAEPSGPSS